MTHLLRRAKLGISAMACMSLFCLALSGFSQRPKPAAPSGPWMNSTLSPDERANLVLKE